MFLKLQSVPNSTQAQIDTWAIANGITAIKIVQNVPCLHFDLEQMHSLLEAVPDLRRRPWCFDASSDIVECEAKYFVSAPDSQAVELWFSFNDLEKNEIETRISDGQMADLVDDCNFAELQNGRLQISECVGREYSGEEIWQDTPVTVYDWSESFGQNRSMITKIFTAYLLRFGGEWLKSISKNVPTS